MFVSKRAGWRRVSVIASISTYLQKSNMFYRLTAHHDVWGGGRRRKEPNGNGPGLLKVKIMHRLIEDGNKGDKKGERRGHHGGEKRLFAGFYLSHGANTKLPLLLSLDPDVTSSITFEHTLWRAAKYSAWCERPKKKKKTPHKTNKQNNRFETV